LGCEFTPKESAQEAIEFSIHSRRRAKAQQHRGRTRHQQFALKKKIAKGNYDFSPMYGRQPRIRVQDYQQAKVGLLGNAGGKESDGGRARK
jgi:hypothetical protein